MPDNSSRLSESADKKQHNYLFHGFVNNLPLFDLCSSQKTSGENARSVILEATGWSWSWSSILGRSESRDFKFGRKLRLEVINSDAYLSLLELKICSHNHS